MNNNLYHRQVGLVFPSRKKEGFSSAKEILEKAYQSRTYLYKTLRSKLSPKQVADCQQALIYVEQAIKQPYSEQRCMGILIGHRNSIATLIGKDKEANLIKINQFINSK